MYYNVILSGEICSGWHFEFESILLCTLLRGKIDTLAREYVISTSLSLMAGSPERLLRKLSSLNSHFTLCVRESLSAATLMVELTYFVNSLVSTCSRLRTSARRQHICMRFNRSISVKNAQGKRRRDIIASDVVWSQNAYLSLDKRHFDELKPSDI